MSPKKLIRKLGLNLNQIKDEGIVRIIEKGDLIPKIIHQTYFKKELSPQIQTGNSDFMMTMILKLI